MPECSPGLSVKKGGKPTDNAGFVNRFIRLSDKTETMLKPVPIISIGSATGVPWKFAPVKTSASFVRKIGLSPTPFSSISICSTAKLIDDEVSALAEEADVNCRKILKDNIDQLHIVANGLLEYETLTGDEIKDLIKGIKPTRDDFDNDLTSESKITPSVPKAGDSTAPQTN